jgi:hypothetical protein
MQDFNSGLFKQKLLDTNSRSIFLNSHPKKSLNKIDLLSLCDLKPELEAERISYALFSNIPFRLSFQLNLNNLNKNQKRLLHLLRRNNDYKNELDLDPFAIGYPLVELGDKKNKGVLSIPLLIWDLQISGFQKRSGRITITRKSNQSAVVNPALIGLIKREYDPNFKDIYSVREYYDTSDLKKNIKSILDVLKVSTPSFDYWFGKMDRFQENPPKFDSFHKSRLINNGVFGLYANSKESLISDYTKLEDSNVACHFNFPLDQNDSLFPGVALDHSQQRVIRSMNQKKNIVIQGPPGTGKSKTLTASIVYLLSKGFSCLIVCEKKTALDVLYDNMKSLSLEEFCIQIGDVRKDRRKVVNKARASIENINLSSPLFTDAKVKKYRSTEGEEKLVAQKMEKVNEVVTLINKTKKRLNEDLLETRTSYSDLVVYVKTNRHKELSEQFNLDTNSYIFTFEEFEHLQKLFEEITREFDNTFNPFQSIYELLNPLIFELSQDSFEHLIASVYAAYQQKLIELQTKLDAALVGKSRFAFKYMDYSDDNNEELTSIQNEYRFYFNKIKETQLLNKTLENKINAIDLKEKISILKSALSEIFRQKKVFSKLNEFHFSFESKNKRDQFLIKQIGTNEKFKWEFFEWYSSHILSQNFIDNFDFNGFDKGYHDIELDITHINNFIIKKAYTQLARKRLKGISKFKKQSELTLEQFFAKKNTQKRKKLSLFKISSHESDIFKSFFPVCMTNPNSCASLFPMEKGYFDYVIFDESSQLKIEDTFTSLLRGKKAIVSGDVNQLPPMDYFEESREEVKSESEINQRSLLDFAIIRDFSAQYLDIHYRSKHPDLIQFSNAAFYNSRLIAKPPSQNYCPIEFYSVKGRFINQLNEDEATAIVNYIETKINITKSVGIATFSVKQKDNVLNELELRSKQSLSFYKKLEKLRANGLFVKNIENIQGEERDIIIMGTTYGLDINQSFKEYLGPINTKKKGHKLLNVIITRAIEKMVIFSSIPEVIFSNYKSLIEQNGNRGKSILYAYLYYAKALSEKKTDKVAEVLETVSQKKFNNRYKRELDSKSLQKFSDFFIQHLSEKIGDKVTYKNYFKVGGYEFELAIKKRKGKTLLIDLNGKVAYDSYEDYIFDIDRCQVAKKSNHDYYRLWLSNYYNNPDFEMKKIIDLLNK